jgi:hypothetical protein
VPFGGTFAKPPVGSRLHLTLIEMPGYFNNIRREDVHDAGYS